MRAFQIYSFILSLMAAWFSTFAISSVARAQILKGSATTQHQFKLGEKFNEKDVPTENTDSIWAPIPSDIAGTWHTDYETELQETPLGQVPVKIENHQTYTFGEQKDIQGTIWDYMPAPEVRRADSGSTKVIFIIRSRTFTTNPVGVVYEAERIMIDNTNRVTAVDQSEQQVKLYPNQPRAGIMHQEATVTSSLLPTAQRFMLDNILIEPHHRIDNAYGKNLHQDFKLWLHSHGLANLDQIRNNRNHTRQILGLRLPVCQERSRKYEDDELKAFRELADLYAEKRDEADQKELDSGALVEICR